MKNIVETTEAPVDRERMAVALEEFLRIPPDNVPSEVIEAFGPVIRTDDGILPPRVFLEAVEQSSVAISITNTRANILYANKSFEKLTGYKAEEVLGKNQSILSYKVTPIEVYKELWACLLEQKSWNGVLINKRKDGERYLADLTVAPVIGVENKTSYYLALHRDVTEVHELESQVRNQKVLIESVVDAAPTVMALIDDDGNLILDNHAYKKLLGDLKGQEPAALFMQSLQPDIDKEKSLPFEQRVGLHNREIEIKNEQGIVERWFSCSVVWVNEKNHTADDYFEHTEKDCLLLVANEITLQKRQQNQLKTNALRALMAEQQLVHGMRETLSGAIFQLQAPLNMASAVVSMMERRQENNGENTPFLSALTDVIQSGEKVLSSLQKALPQDDSETVSLINVNEVIKDVIDLSIHRLLEFSVLVDWDAEPDLPYLNGRNFALRTLFKQIIDNAIDAINTPGCAQREISIQTRKAEDAVEVIVRDSGPGIEAANRHSVFEPFNSAWKHIKGRPGMGLTIALQMAQLHHGDIEIETNYNKGCSVKVRLPFTPARLLTEDGNE